MIMATVSGSAYLFKNTGVGWTQIAKLSATDGAAENYFGHSVSISGNTAIVGTHDTVAPSAYVFEDLGSGWTQLNKLAPSDGVIARGYERFCRNQWQHGHRHGLRQE